LTATRTALTKQSRVIIHAPLRAEFNQSNLKTVNGKLGLPTMLLDVTSTSFCNTNNI